MKKHTKNASFPALRPTIRPVQLELPLVEAAPPDRRFLNFPFRDPNASSAPVARAPRTESRPLAA